MKPSQLMKNILEKSMEHNIMKMIAAYAVAGIIFVLYDINMIFTAVIALFVFLIPIYLIGRYCIQRGFLTSVLYLALLFGIMYGYSFLRFYETVWLIGSVEYFTSITGLSLYYLHLYTITVLILYIMKRFIKKSTVKYAAERSIRSINLFWIFIPIASIVNFINGDFMLLLILFFFAFIFGQFFYYLRYAHKYISIANNDVECKEIILYTSLNNTVLAPSSNTFTPIGKLLFADILGHKDNKMVITEAIGNLYRVFPYEIVRSCNTTLLKAPIKKVIVCIDQQDRKRCKNKKFLRLAMHKIDQMLLEEKEILVVTVGDNFQSIAEELESRKVRYKSYPSPDKLDYNDIEAFIHFRELTEQEKRIRQEIWELSSRLPEDNKCGPILYQLLSIYNTFNSTELFYQLLRIIEYIIHYRALYVISRLEVKTAKEINSFAFGVWAGIQNRLQQTSERYPEGSEVLSAYTTVRKLLMQPASAKSCTMEEIIQSMVEMRNKLLGHGSITFSVSNTLLEALTILTRELVLVFLNDNSQLDPSSRIVVGENENDGIVCYLADGSILSYWIHNGEEMFEEYLNYVSGNVTRKGKEFTINLNMEGEL